MLQGNILDELAELANDSVKTKKFWGKSISKE
jgi:hypothetical protein